MGWGIGRDLEYAWVVCGTVNAKNSFGGYVGAQPFYAAIRAGRLVNADFSNPEKYGIRAAGSNRAATAFTNGRSRFHRRAVVSTRDYRLHRNRLPWPVTTRRSDDPLARRDRVIAGASTTP